MKQLTLIAAGAIASRVSGLSVLTSKSTDAKKKTSLPKIEWFPVTSRWYVRTDKCNLSIMITGKFHRRKILPNFVSHPRKLPNYMTVQHSANFSLRNTHALPTYLRKISRSKVSHLTVPVAKTLSIYMLCIGYYTWTYFAARRASRADEYGSSC